MDQDTTLHAVLFGKVWTLTEACGFECAICHDYAQNVEVCYSAPQDTRVICCSCMNKLKAKAPSVDDLSNSN